MVRRRITVDIYTDTDEEFGSDLDLLLSGYIAKTIKEYRDSPDIARVLNVEVESELSLDIQTSLRTFY